jgi:uncharacterized protein YndB with AHSA1/START domain
VPIRHSNAPCFSFQNRLSASQNRGKTWVMTKATGRKPVMGDDAVMAKTGKDWAQWCAVLDKAGCKDMTHKQIVAFISKKHPVGPWWQQMVTVGYEQMRGLRVKHQTANGYSVSASRVMNIPASAAFKAFKDAKLRNKWLPKADMTIRKSTPPKSLRITWTEDDTNVEVNLYVKGTGKSQISIEHNKLPDAKSAAQMKAYWGKALDRLKALNPA